MTFLSLRGLVVLSVSFSSDMSLCVARIFIFLFTKLYHITYEQCYLSITVSAEKGLDKGEEDKKGRVLRQERYSGACSLSFYVGDVKPEDVKAKYESGVLTVLIPKEEPKKLTSGSKIAIE